MLYVSDLKQLDSVDKGSAFRAADGSWDLVRGLGFEVLGFRVPYLILFS